MFLEEDKENHILNQQRRLQKQESASPFTGENQQ